MKMLPRVSAQRNLACLHRAVGGLHCRNSFRAAPLLTAAPTRALIDEQISITGRFLPPRCPVTVCAQMHSEDGDLWESCAHYHTKDDGTINLTTDQSVGGSYLDCEPMGLFWSLQPARSSREGLRLRKKNVEAPFIVLLSLLEGHVCPSEEPSATLAVLAVERWYMAPGVRRMEIRQNGVVGTLFLPPGPGPFPAMLDLWGLGGGLLEYRSALFASRGYASLSLAYIGHSELPGPHNCVNVGHSYFKAAFQLLQDHHQVDAERVGILGISYGAYLTLRTATQADVKPSCLVCINGPMGSFMKFRDAEGRTEQIESEQRHWTFNDQSILSIRDATLPANLAPGSVVKLEHLTCPLMYIEGEDDLNSASTENANLIEETLKAAGKSHLLTRLSYPGAGHLIEPPYAPNSRASLWSAKPAKVFIWWGGHPAPHAAAQEDAWNKILEFLNANLRQ